MPYNTDEYFPYFGTNVKYLRLKRGESQREIADEIGVTKGLISHIENRKQMPIIHNLHKLSLYFEVTINDLLLKNLAK